MDQYESFLETMPIFKGGGLPSRTARTAVAGEKGVAVKPHRNHDNARTHSANRREPSAGALGMTPEKDVRPTHRIIGVIEQVTLRGPKGEIQVRAKVDTGAARTSIDTDLATKLGLGPVERRVHTRSAAADRPEERDVVKATLIIDGEVFEPHVTVTDRKDMRYHVIVGMDVLRKSSFLVSPRKGAGLGKGRAHVKAEP